MVLEKKLNISYACNDAYAQQTGISMISLFENNREFDKITIYFVDMGLSIESKQRLKDITKAYNRGILFFDFTKLCKNLTIKKTGRHIASVYAKLFFSSFKSIDKILYLDSDTIINSSLGDLWAIDLNAYYVAGVETISSIKLNSVFGMNPKEQPINDGVVLINLKEWRKYNLEEAFLDYIDSFNGNPPVLSEGTINAVCRGKIKIIDPQYNLLSGIVYFKSIEIQSMTKRSYYKQESINDAIKKPVIIHYLAAFYNRPWCKTCSHPLKNHYLEYKKLSPWAEIPLEDKKLSYRLILIDFLHKILPMKIFLLLQKMKSQKRE